jgi:hypothetical protein
MENTSRLYNTLVESLEQLADWQDKRHLKTLVWITYCLIRISIIYRGRAIPLVWKAIEHQSSTIAFETYRDLLDAARCRLPYAFAGSVVFLADRGFADTALMNYLSNTLGWHWRIRIKENFLVYRPGKRGYKLSRVKPKAGEAHFLHNVYLTAERFGLVHLALANLKDTKEQWLIASDQITSLDSFDEYGLRFDIEENFLDDKSNGFQLTSSQLRDTHALERLCFLLAVTTLYLVSLGTEVVAQQQRRLVAPHWFSGNSYLKIGWQMVKHACFKGWSLSKRLMLSSLPDPEPSVASRAQFWRLPTIRLRVTFFRFEAPLL